MNKKLKLTIAFVFLPLAIALCGEIKTFTVRSDSTNAAKAVVQYGNSFVGEIDEVAVYAPAAVTSSVSVALVNPYSGAEWVIATNAGVVGAWIWKPRVAYTDMDGQASLVLTNSATADRINVVGERVKATISNVSTTNAVIRVAIKTK